MASSLPADDPPGGDEGPSGSALRRFLQTEYAGGVVLLVAAVVAVVWASSGWSSSYASFWGTKVSVGFGDDAIRESLQHWVNDLLMAVFFFVVGLEIKREVVHGELRSPRAAALPIVCAIGGMVVPALVYLAVIGGAEGGHGWGIPMATDIAFALGVLALVGSRVPSSLKLFLLTLAIVDDLGAIAVIAVFYADDVSLGWLVVAAAAVVVVLVMRRAGVTPIAAYVPVGAVLWFAVFESGVHATVAGVVLALLTPARPVGGREAPTERLEHLLHPWSAFVILPLFALTNAGINLTSPGGAPWSSPVGRAVFLGLVVGKPVGIVTAAAIAVRTRLAPLPDGATWRDLVGVGAIAGIGLTVSLFITDLAFEPHLQAEAKVAILTASLVAGALGAAVFLARRAP